MWPFKHRRSSEDIMIDPHVTCIGCGHIIDKRYASMVYENNRPTRFYCTLHKKPYDRIDYNYHGSLLFYRTNVQCDREGTPIGYKPIDRKGT